MVDFEFVIHCEEKPAMCAPSALVLQEFSSGSVQPDILPPSRTPVAPVAIIWACSPVQRRVSFDGRVPVFPKHVGVACYAPRLASSFVVFLKYPLGTFLGVLPLGPAEYLVPQHMVQFLEGSCADGIFVVIAPTYYCGVERSYYIVNGRGFHPFYDRCQCLVVPVYAAFARFYDGLIGRMGFCLVLPHWELTDRES